MQDESVVCRQTPVALLLKASCAVSGTFFNHKEPPTVSKHFALS